MKGLSKKVSLSGYQKSASMSAQQRWLMIAVCIITISGCEKLTFQGTGRPAVMMPLVVGNTWSYLLSEYDTTGALVDSFTFSRAILSDTVISAEHWYDIDPIRSNCYCYCNRDDGVWIQTSGVTPFLIAKYPAEIGEQWLAVDGAYIIEVTGVGVAGVVPAGTFVGYEYKWYRASPSAVFDEIREFWCPGIGNVSERFYNKNRFGFLMLESKRELVRYSIQE